MSDKQPHSPKHTDVLKKQAMEQSEVKEVLNFLKKYGVPTLVAIIVICGIYLFDRSLKSSKAKKEATADTALLAARTPADFEEIVEDYGKTSSGPIALMSLGMARFSEGNYTAAQAHYSEFLKKYGDHDMALQAELNLITCQEELGGLSEAHLKYGEFAAAHPDSYLAPLARMGQARCLESMGSLEEARRAYEDLIVAYPGSSWANVAETRMKVISSKLQ